MQLEETLTLIELLYSPHQSSDVILKTQQKLQSIQKQDNANLLAHELLKSNSQNAQFFGALTYTVYFTTHYNSILNLNDFTLLLLNELIDAFNRNLSSLIINKLISNLAKIYIKSLLNPLNSLFEKLLLNNQNNQNNEKVINLALLSCKIFAEEINISSDLLLKDQHEIILNDLFDLSVKNILNSTLNPITKDLWLDCLQAWMNYLIKIEFDFSIKIIDLNNYFNLIIDLILNNNDINSINLLIDLYDLNPSLLNSSNKLKLDNLLFSDWTLNFINLNLNDVDNLSKLSKLITLFLDSNLINLASKLIDSNFDYKFQFLLNLSNQKNIPIINDPFSVDLLDFWILFTESFINDIETIYIILKNDKFKINLLNEKSHNYFLNLSEIYWKKCHLIENDDNLNDYFDEFKNFRRDIGELFESLFSIARNEIFNNLINSIIINLNNDSILLSNNQINDIETSLYLLTSICSILTENGISSELLDSLSSLFNSKFLEKIILIENNSKYNYLIKSSIKFLSEINWFYENSIGINYINDVLIFLFQNLNEKIFQDLSSKAILMITDSCRDNLSNLVNDFEIAANSMITNKFDVEIIVRSRIIRSYANILQTVKILDLKSKKISNFLDLIYNESINVYKLINSNDNLNNDNLENINNFILSMISSLVGLAKGFQIPEDWEDYFENNENEINEIYNYWKFNDKYQVHDKCLKLISLYSFPNEIIGFGTNLNSKILNQIFEFFKAGLNEPFPGPFVIDENLIIEFIIKCCHYCQENYNLLKINKSEHPMIKIIQLYGLIINSNHVMNTISKVTNLQLGIDNLKMDEVINEILFKQFNQVILDVDLIQEIFTLCANIISKYPSDLLKNKNIIKILQISIEQLYINNQQRFIIISLSKLWTNLIYLRKGKLEDIEFIKNLLINENFGNLLVYTLMKGFINTSRSNIEFYSDIIRSLTVKYGNYLNNWINESFNKINSEKKIIEDEEVDKFIKKLILTRGNRAANRVIQDFWYKLTGLVDYGICN